MPSLHEITVAQLSRLVGTPEAPILIDVRVPDHRAEDPRSRILKRTAQELGSDQVDVAEKLEQAALKALQERHPERVLATNVEYYSAVVLDVAEIPPPLAPAMFACSRVAGWSAHILEQKRTGRLFRPSARYVGPAPRSLTAAPS